MHAEKVPILAERTSVTATHAARLSAAASDTPRSLKSSRGLVRLLAKRCSCRHCSLHCRPGCEAAKTSCWHAAMQLWQASASEGSLRLASTMVVTVGLHSVRQNLCIQCMAPNVTVCILALVLRASWWPVAVQREHTGPQPYGGHSCSAHEGAPGVCEQLQVSSARLQRLIDWSKPRYPPAMHLPRAATSLLLASPWKSSTSSISWLWCRSPQTGEPSDVKAQTDSIQFAMAIVLKHERSCTRLYQADCAACGL